MAKPLDERIAAAMAPNARAATVIDLIDELGAAIETATVDQARQDELSKSAEVSEPDADAAADQAAKLARRILRLRAKSEQLHARRDELLASERRKRLEGEHAAAKAERDRLVMDLCERWPALTAELVSLLSRIRDNDAACSRANAGRGTGLDFLASAESIARNTSRCGVDRTQHKRPFPSPRNASRSTWRHADPAS